MPFPPYIATLPGELSAKVVAKSFWKEEVHRELEDLNILDKWSFKTGTGSLSGTYEDAMVYADNIRSLNLYLHDCSMHCKERGTGAL